MMSKAAANNGFNQLSSIREMNTEMIKERSLKRALNRLEQKYGEAHLVLAAVLMDLQDCLERQMKEREAAEVQARLGLIITQNAGRLGMLG